MTSGIHHGVSSRTSTDHVNVPGCMPRYDPLSATSSPKLMMENNESIRNPNCADTATPELFEPVCQLPIVSATLPKSAHLPMPQLAPKDAVATAPNPHGPPSTYCRQTPTSNDPLNPNASKLALNDSHVRWSDSWPMANVVGRMRDVNRARQRRELRDPVGEPRRKIATARHEIRDGELHPAGQYILLRCVVHFAG